MNMRDCVIQVKFDRLPAFYLRAADVSDEIVGLIAKRFFLKTETYPNAEALEKSILPVLLVLAGELGMTEQI